MPARDGTVPLDPAWSRMLPAALWVLAAGALAAAILSDVVRPGAMQGFGVQQTVLVLLAFAAAAAAIELRRPDARAALLSAPLLSAERRAALGRFALVTLQVVLLLLVMRAFRLESPAFYDRIFVLAAAGFVLHDALPMRMRLPFFVALSLAGIYLIFGLSGGAWLFGLGLLLIGICHLPIRFALRVALLLTTGTGLALLRAEVLPGPVPGAIWPILGSMFMFRLIVYLYDLRHSKEPFDWRRTLAYFFMLPNLTFPLFPVIDWTMFRRTYYDEERYWIYQRGVQWMTRGVTHLLLYRVIDQYVALSPAAVQNAGDLIQFMVANYLLYLRVSGQFHLVVGMLHLFGFRLPETHHLFFLASSFTDFWRRINIYWKDFMMKVVYYPTFFAVRKRGTMFGIIVATLVVFLTTWALHAYQWFWLLGTVLLTWPDVLFWTVLAVLLVINTVIETKRGRSRPRAGQSWTGAALARRAVQTLAFFAVMCILWSFWSAESVGQWFGLWTVLGDGGTAATDHVAPLLAVTAIVALRLPEFRLRRAPRRQGRFARAAWPTLIALAVALAVARFGGGTAPLSQPAPSGAFVFPAQAASDAAPIMEE